MCGCAVKKTGGETAQTAVAECFILNIFEAGNIHSACIEKITDLVKNSHAVKIVENHTAHEIFSGEIERLTLVSALVFRFDPRVSHCFHARS